MPVAAGLGRRRGHAQRAAARHRARLPRPGGAARRPLPLPAPRLRPARGRRRAHRQRPRRGPGPAGRAASAGTSPSRTTRPASTTSSPCCDRVRPEPPVGVPPAASAVRYPRRMADPLCLLTVHAHPDDEASKGARHRGPLPRRRRPHRPGQLHRRRGGRHPQPGDGPARGAGAHRRGPPGGAGPRPRRSSATTRSSCSATATRACPTARPTPTRRTSPTPRCDEAVGRLVEIIRRERPQVIVTYGDDQRGYPHPDHLRVHDISLPAFDAAGDPTAYPELGEPWEPSKLYYSVWSRARIQATHDKFVELGLESPFGEDWFKRPSQDDQHHHRIDIADWLRRAPRRAAGPRHPGRPDLAVLVRPAPRGLPHGPPLRRLRPGPQPGRQRPPRDATSSPACGRTGGQPPARWRSRSSRKPMRLTPERSTMALRPVSWVTRSWSSTRLGQSGNEARSSGVSRAGWT